MGFGGFKTIMKNVPEDRLIDAVRAGDDVIAPSQQAASRIARAAGGGKRPVGPERSPGGRPHYHVNGREGAAHVFYSAAAALTFSHYAKDASPLVQGAAAVADFFNPLSIANDIIEVAEELRPAKDQQPKPPEEEERKKQ